MNVGSFPDLPRIFDMCQHVKHARQFDGRNLSAFTLTETFDGFEHVDTIVRKTKDILDLWQCDMTRCADLGGSSVMFK